MGVSGRVTQLFFRFCHSTQSFYIFLNDFCDFLSHVMILSVIL
jgi:hypothetical protein